MKKQCPQRTATATEPVVQMQVIAQRYISHHRPPAISRKIGSLRRAGGGSGAERRSRNSVRARSCALGSGAPVAVWPRARTRVASPAASTPHKYPVEVSSPVLESTFARISVARGPRAASGALPARWPPCSGGGAWRCCGWSRSARLPPARPASARRRRPPPAPRKMRRRRAFARARPPTPPSRRRRRQRPTRPLTPSGGGRAHAWAQPCCCVLPARWPDRTCDADSPPQPPSTPCSRFKYRGARAWSGWARRGDRACGTTTDTTIPHWNGKSSRGCKLWWGVSKRWWSRRRARDQPPLPSGSACRPAYSCPTASMARTRTYSYESLISKPS